MADSMEQEALIYHREPVAGKLAIQPTKPLSNQHDLALAYSPGVAFACTAIEKDNKTAADYTARGNLVGVVSNGTAVLGLGAIGPLAGKPVMEGKAVLFKKFANIDVFDIEIDETDTEKLIDIIASLEPTFGGINLEDIKAPECFIVEQRLRERMSIPVFHDDQHGTAIVSAAAVYNGLKIVGKALENVKLVVSGAGAASIACVDLLVSMGLNKDNVIMCDSKGVIYEGRQEGMNEWKKKYAVQTNARSLDDAMMDSDIFMGLSGPGVLSAEAVETMAHNPLVLAMSNPVPEIMPEVARQARPDAILATGRSDYPNQVNNVLCFPFIFRGALDCGATTINDEMKQACVKAIAELATKEPTEEVTKAYAGQTLKFGRDYLIPKPFDPRLIEEIPVAVVKAAMKSGVATRPIEDMGSYRRKLHSYVSSSRIFMQPVIERALTVPDAKIVFAEGENQDVLLALQSIVDEGIARPFVIGRPNIIERKLDELSLRISIGKDIEVVDPLACDNHEEYCRYYHNKVGRSGVSVEAAQNSLLSNNTVLAAVMTALGEVDGVICGKVGRFDHHLRDITTVLSNQQMPMTSSVCAVLLQDGPLFIADPFVNVDPSEDQLVVLTQNCLDFIRKFGIEPKVALLSHSNFGTYDDEGAHKMKIAAERLRVCNPDLEIDGEMHAISAFNEQLRSSIFKNNRLTGRANLLIMPNMDAASIALGLSRSISNAIMVGPYLNGLDNAAHILIPSVSARGIFNMAALTVEDAIRQRAVANINGNSVG
ncbi:MAG: NADP-dependent malic enzyme [Gammaproteobacteria bacterium]|uniref:NADP-dependent malic enzyme n=1 Tax=OM182 bacterium TaxID=2510334 RepID=A0A520S2L2_9GAMM|nr:NADP-dependent malic enzyme [Gammaproteobacteria bacterium]OUV68254.1 MAG: NADP-dependent malic enzyme [Gammaproteobacteria bacterium TMED133]RZO76661.1 MAG: NADP-dependent malic enzyme [OM182 bacterium]